ncbi:MAG: conjugal transfer protein TraI [Flavipsychrobacter sp.]
MKWKRISVITAILFISYCRPADAQIPIVGLITSAVKKVIVAIDLKVQQMQNRTLALQNAEKELENKMALGNLNDISGWLDKEKQLYAGYYQELQQVKAVIATYEMVKNVVKQQEELVSAYHQAYALFSQDKNFSPDELNSMRGVYIGILDASVQNLNEVLLAVTNLSTSMSDGERLSLVHKAAIGMQHNMDDLRQYNSSNVQLSLRRAQDQQSRATVKKLYGL